MELLFVVRCRGTTAVIVCQQSASRTTTDGDENKQGSEQGSKQANKAASDNRSPQNDQKTVGWTLRFPDFRLFVHSSRTVCADSWRLIVVFGKNILLGGNNPNHQQSCQISKPTTNNTGRSTDNKSHQRSLYLPSSCSRSQTYRNRGRRWYGG